MPRSLVELDLTNTENPSAHQWIHAGDSKNVFVTINFSVNLVNMTMTRSQALVLLDQLKNCLGEKNG